jgi:hypothetical protein
MEMEREATMEQYGDGHERQSADPLVTVHYRHLPLGALNVRIRRVALADHLSITAPRPRVRAAHSPSHVPSLEGLY